MKKVSVLLTSILAFSSLVFFFSATATAQSTYTPYNLDGTWEISGTSRDVNWSGERSAGTIRNVTVYICQDDDVVLDDEPNLFLYSEGDVEPFDPFYGFVRGSLFSLYKENADNCIGAFDFNLGREMITGFIHNDGNRLRGKGVGFDSDYDCGSVWSYSIRARRVGDLPTSFDCPTWS